MEQIHKMKFKNKTGINSILLIIDKNESIDNIDCFKNNQEYEKWKKTH